MSFKSSIALSSTRQVEHGRSHQKFGPPTIILLYRNLVIFHVENISYVIISYSFNPFKTIVTYM